MFLFAITTIDFAFFLFPLFDGEEFDYFWIHFLLHKLFMRCVLSDVTTREQT